MVNFRRDLTPGGIYFFTVTLKDRKSDFLTRYINLLRDAFKHTSIHNPFRTLAYVILPEHLHVIWQLPDDDADFSKRWRQIKSYFTRQLVVDNIHIVKDARGEYNLWQRRFWEHRIKHDDDLERYMNYIHYNPVKHNLVSSAVDWSFSSIHHYIKKGYFTKDWGGTNNKNNTFHNFGER